MLLKKKIPFLHCNELGWNNTKWLIWYHFSTFDTVIVMEILFGLRDIRYMRYPKWVNWTILRAENLHMRQGCFLLSCMQTHRRYPGLSMRPCVRLSHASAGSRPELVERSEFRMVKLQAFWQASGERFWGWGASQPLSNFNDKKQ